MITNDTVETIGLTGYILANEPSITVANNGPFTWQVGDAVLIQDVNGFNTLWNIFPDFNSVVPISSLNPVLNNIVAHAGGGQTNATQLNTGFNTVVTVATAADSVVLPANVLTQTCIVLNIGANSVNVFPSVGDSINSLATNTAIAVPAGTCAAFYGCQATKWGAIIG
jgi:hypothetical protein